MLHRRDYGRERVAERPKETFRGSAGKLPHHVYDDRAGPGKFSALPAGQLHPAVFGSALFGFI